MKYNKGFTLIELMIVVAIIGIVVMISAGFFGDNVRATNRTEARAALTQTAGSLEKCRSLYGSYNNANCPVLATLPLDTENNYYRISGVIAGATFTLTATPIAGQAQASDGDCTTLTLTNTGVKGATGGDTGECW
ncbi:MAG: type IV pilin protein [Gammaproteobacteria bacterium]|nr:type IV pilin protein [Gammaproteobacteria bacterium]